MQLLGGLSELVTVTISELDRVDGCCCGLDLAGHLCNFGRSLAQNLGVSCNGLNDSVLHCLVEEQEAAEPVGTARDAVIDVVPSGVNNPPAVQALFSLAEREETRERCDGKSGARACLEGVKELGDGCLNFFELEWGPHVFLEQRRRGCLSGDNKNIVGCC